MGAAATALKARPFAIYVEQEILDDSRVSLPMRLSLAVRPIAA
jgi:hypothetical protein